MKLRHSSPGCLQRCSLPSGTSTLLSPPCPGHYQNPQAGAGALGSRNGGCSQHQEEQIQLLDTAVSLWEGSSSLLQLFFHLLQQTSTFLTSCSQIPPASPMLASSLPISSLSLSSPAFHIFTALFSQQLWLEREQGCGPDLSPTAAKDTETAAFRTRRLMIGDHPPLMEQ